MFKFMKLLALAGMLAGLLAVAPNANASSGDARPTPPAPEVPHTECVVSGQVTTPATPAGTIGHSDYQFRSATLVCVGDKGGTYNVTAKGASWGPLPGSSTAASWSDDGSDPETSDKYDYALIRNACDSGNPTVNKGLIEATSEKGSSAGWVKFDRPAASETLAWGKFCVGNLNQMAFTANLLFTPTGTQTTKGTETRDVFDLNGTAVIYNDTK